MKAFHVTTFGCQMNEHDSERMKGMLESLGYREVPERARRRPDPVQHVLDPREGRRPLRRPPARGEGAQAARPRARDRRRRLLGAVGQGAGVPPVPVRRRRLRPRPGAQAGRVPDLGLADRAGLLRVRGLHRPPAAKRAREVQAWMQISVGCNCRCSYCIVPSTRGREVSRPLAELVDEGRRLAADGVTELTLLGQNVNAYGRDLRPERATFAQLLRRVDAIDGVRRIRYTSPHPKDMREDVIRAHAELAAVCEHIHLPLQAGASRILKAMRRTYTRERYLDRVALIREHVPDVALTTDIIVGFPGETEADFARDARGRRGGRLRRRVHVHLLPAPRDRGRPSSTTPSRTRRRSSGCSAWSRSSSAAPASARSASSAARSRCSSRARSRTDPSRAARPHAPQQGRQLRRPRPAGRVRRRRDRRRRRARR